MKRRKPWVFLFDTERENAAFEKGVKAAIKLEKYDGIDMVSFGPYPKRQFFTVELHPFKFSDYKD